MPAPHATADFETYSEAGYVWNDAEQKWESPPGYSSQKRGIKVVGGDRYTAHSTFRPLSLSFDLHDGRGVEGARFEDQDRIYPCPPRLAAWVASGGLVECWYVAFDAHYVWGWCVRNWGWPELPLSQQRCTMAKSRAAAYPGGLDNAAAVLGTPQKDKAGHALIRKLTVPKNPTKKNPSRRWTPGSARSDFEVFYRYNDQDVIAESAVSDLLPELSPFEFDVWTLDQKINRRGMYIDRLGVENCIAIFEQAGSRANAELQRLTLWPLEAIDKSTGEVTQVLVPAVSAATEVANMIRWLHWKGFHVHELDEETLTESLKRSDLADDVRRVLRIRQELAFGSVKKLYAMREQTGIDGRLREQYAYHAAHTSLWNGQGAQPANLPRPMHDAFEKPEEVDRALAVIACRSIELVEYEFGPGSAWATKHGGKSCDPLEVVASCLRSMIVAAPGHRLISADFNAIQAVVTSCLAGEQWRIDVFETHGKIYEAMAARLTGIPFDEIVNHKKLTGKHHPSRQNPGKLAVLSGDFGAWINGWKRFGADKLLGSDENIKAAIMKTRRAQPNIVELWGGQTRDKFQYEERAELYGLEGAIVKALLDPGQAFEYRGTVYQMVGDTLYCQTVDGGLMRYHNAKLYPSVRPYARTWEYEISYEGWNSNAAKGAQGWQTMNLYGGVATQNVVSRVSRQVQAHALLRLEAAGYPIVMHTHDENVAEVPIGSHHTAAEHTRLTAILPDWAKLPDGRPWPIKVPDSWEQPRYGKW